MPWLTAYVNEEFEKPANWKSIVESLMYNAATEFGISLDQIEYREIQLAQSISAFNVTIQLEFSVSNIRKLLTLYWRMKRLNSMYYRTLRYHESVLRSSGLTIRPLIFAQFREVLEIGAS